MMRLEIEQSTAPFRQVSTASTGTRMIPAGSFKFEPKSDPHSPNKPRTGLRTTSVEKTRKLVGRFTGVTKRIAMAARSRIVNHG